MYLSVHSTASVVFELSGKTKSYSTCDFLTTGFIGSLVNNQILLHVYKITSQEDIVVVESMTQCIRAALAIQGGLYHKKKITILVSMLSLANSCSSSDTVYIRKTHTHTLTLYVYEYWEKTVKKISIHTLCCSTLPSNYWCNNVYINVYTGTLGPKVT